MKRMLLSITLLMVSQIVMAVNPKQLNLIENIAKQINYAEEQSVWPGFHPAKTPSVVFFGYEITNDFVAYGLSFKELNAPWEKLSSPYNIYHLSNAAVLGIDDDTNENFIDINGEKVFVVTELVDKFIQQRASYYMAFESQIDTKKSEFINIPYDNYHNLNMMKLFYLEMSALHFVHQNDATRSEAALKDAVAIRQYRQKLSTNDAVRFEDGMELVRGIPTYIGLAVNQYNEDMYSKMSQREGCAPLQAVFGSQGLIDCILGGHQGGFNAYVAAVYAHELDKKMPGQTWKLEAEKSFKPASRFMMNYYHLSDNEAERLANEAMKKPEYAFDRISKIIDFNMMSYIQHYNDIKTRFENTKGIEVRTGFDLFEKVESHSNDDTFMLDISGKLYEDINFAVKNNPKKKFNILEFHHLPFLFGREGSTNFSFDPSRSYSSFKIHDEAEFILDGKKMSAKSLIQEKTVTPFHTIEIIDPYIHLKQTVKEGKLDASNGMIKF